jgi:hypothetical protein
METTHGAEALRDHVSKYLARRIGAQLVLLERTQVALQKSQDLETFLTELREAETRLSSLEHETVGLMRSLCWLGTLERSDTLRTRKS